MEQSFQQELRSSPGKLAAKTEVFCQQKVRWRGIPKNSTMCRKNIYCEAMIGVFDSGYGGLTILKDLLKELPQYDYMYLGDNARAPYGNRSNETLIKYGEQAVEYLFEQGCALIIIACNTASSNVLRHLQEKYLRKPGVTNRKILGVIKPQVEAAIKISKQGKIGVVGTNSTIESKSFDIELKNLRPDLQIAKQACPLLVPLIEEDWYRKPETKMILKKYLRGIKSYNVDTLILGCTHYPFLYRDFCRIMGKNVNVINPGPIVAQSLKDYLERHPEIQKELTSQQQASEKSQEYSQKAASKTSKETAQTSKRIFLTTGDPQKFQKLGSEFLGYSLKEVRHVDLAR